MNWTTIINTEVPNHIRLFSDTIALAGGETWAVGGWVRDHVCGRPAKDVDIEVSGVSVETLQALPGWIVRPAGHRMGVFLVCRGPVFSDADMFEVALPQRRERFGLGHMDERAIIDTDLPIAKSLARRDFTMNAMSVNLITAEFVDPFHGQEHLADGVLVEVDPINFVFDPVRVLRAMRFLSTHNLVPSDSLVAAAHEHVNLVRFLDDNRMRKEWCKWAESIAPANGIAFLVASGWIEGFPTIAAMQWIGQDAIWHPEGDAMTHTICALEESQSVDPIVNWAILLHDIGKVSTTSTNDAGRIVSPGHADVGSQMVVAALREFGFDIKDDNIPAWPQAVQALVREHMFLASFGNSDPSASAVRRFARRIAPANVSQWAQVVMGDVMGRGTASDMDHAMQAVRMAERAAECHVLNNAPTPIIMGRHLIQMGLQPGPHFGAILEEAMSAQMEGYFDNESDGIEWVWDWLN